MLRGGILTSRNFFSHHLHLPTLLYAGAEATEVFGTGVHMDVSNISSVASSVSASKLAQAGTESQVRVAKKQSDQQAQVAATIIGSATEPQQTSRSDRGKLLAIA